MRGKSGFSSGFSEVLLRRGARERCRNPRSSFDQSSRTPSIEDIVMTIRVKSFGSLLATALALLLTALTARAEVASGYADDNGPDYSMSGQARSGDQP
jgi:hypothetical protein